MHKPLLQSLLVLLSLFALAPAGASISSNGKAFSPEEGLDLSRSFEAQRKAIVQALGDGETYIEIAHEDRVVVQKSLDRISNLLGDAQSVDQLPETTKVQVFNEQERINALLTRAHADSRLICRREKPTGSNRPTNVCLSVAERRRHREAAADYKLFMPKSEGDGQR